MAAHIGLRFRGALLAWCLASSAFAQSRAPTGPGTRPCSSARSRGRSRVGPTITAFDRLLKPASRARIWSSGCTALRGKLSSSSLYAGRPTSIGSISGRGRRHRPSAATLRDPNSFVDLSNPLAKIRWVVRTSGFHQIRPVVRLADGTWLVGEPYDGTAADFNEADVSIADVRCLKLDVDRVVSVGTWVEYPDLSKVDEVGFAGLMPGSGHGPGGDVNVGRIEVYGDPIKR